MFPNRHRLPPSITLMIKEASADSSNDEHNLAVSELMVVYSKKDSAFRKQCFYEVREYVTALRENIAKLN